MAFVTLPGQIGPLVGPALGGFLVEYASWHWIFLINLPVGVVGALATLWLMPNYTTRTRRFDISGFIMLAIGMATLTLALDGHKGLGLPPLAIAGLGFTPFHAGLMMIPMIIGSMGMKRIIVRVVNRFGYRRVLVSATLLLAAVSLSFPLVALMGWTLLLPIVLFFQGMLNALRFSTMNTLALKDLPNRLASSGNSLLSMVMQLSMSLGVSTAGILLGVFAHNEAVTNTPATHSAFLYSYICMAIIIALPALIFNRVPPDTGTNRNLPRASAKTANR